MLKVNRQSGGFIPWNEIYPKKHLSLGIPVVPLWRDSYKSSYAIPLGSFAPYCFAMSYVYPVKFTIVTAKRISLGSCPHRASVSGAFFTSILVNDAWC